MKHAISIATAAALALAARSSRRGSAQLDPDTLALFKKNAEDIIPTGEEDQIAALRELWLNLGGSKPIELGTARDFIERLADPEGTYDTAERLADAVAVANTVQSRKRGKPDLPAYGRGGRKPTRDELIAWMAWDDPNGVYTDEDRAYEWAGTEGAAPFTDEEAIEQFIYHFAEYGEDFAAQVKKILAPVW